jgi:uncharacterized membrane protein YeaQ/YmgE (transglycosylase-associated protein family)
MGILSWVLFGLIAGAIAKFVMPGKQGSGWIMTIVLGIVGAVVGGYLGTMFGIGNVSGFNIPSLLIAVGGGVLVLFIYSAVNKKS